MRRGHKKHLRTIEASEAEIKAAAASKHTNPLEDVHLGDIFAKTKSYLVRKRVQSGEPENLVIIIDNGYGGNAFGKAKPLASDTYNYQTPRTKISVFILVIPEENWGAFRTAIPQDKQIDRPMDAAQIEGLIKARAKIWDFALPDSRGHAR